MTDDEKSEQAKRIADLAADMYAGVYGKYTDDEILSACASILAIGSRAKTADEEDVVCYITRHSPDGFSLVYADTDISIVGDGIYNGWLPDDIGLNDSFIVKKQTITLDEDMDEIDSILSDDNNKETIH